MANRAVGLMPKKEFIKALASKLNVTQGVAITIIEAVEDVVLDGLVENNKVKLGDLVTFTKQEVPSRRYKLPNDDTEYESEAHIKIIADMVEGNRRLNRIKA